MNDTVHENITNTGTIATLDFLILNDAKVGTYPITIECNLDMDESLNKDLQGVPLYIIDGSIRIGGMDSVSESESSDGRNSDTNGEQQMGPPAIQTTSKIPFIDITNSTHYGAILWAAQEGVASGTTKTTFSPNEICTRAQAVTFLWRAKGMPEPVTTVNPFNDVKPDSYFYKAVLWASENGIAAGRNGGTVFAPSDPVSRANVVTFLYRLDGQKVVNVANSFRDVTTTAYYSTPVAWASSKGIAQGFSDGTFRPNVSCTRGQIVTFMYRYFK